MPKAEYSPQGKKLWNLICRAGWNQYKKLTPKEKKKYGDQVKYKRYELWLMFRYNVTHINALTAQQMGGAIATMTRYAETAEKKKAQDAPKRMRSAIMATVMTHGKDADWLHENMQAWKFGESLRKLDFPQLVSVRLLVMQALGVK